MAQPTVSPRILSVQSHVVSGYCGNKSASFPLQLLGFEVDPIYTVQLSNHTQYKVTRGQIFGSKELMELRSGLEANGLLKFYDNVLSGYMADISYIESMASLVGSIKLERERNNFNKCFYTLDPVLGDDGVGFYVPDGANIAEAYKKHLLPIADMITPNRFEASKLSNTDIDASSDSAIRQAIQAIDVFHSQMNIPIVVITSLEHIKDPGQLICILSHDPSVSRSSQGSFDVKSFTLAENGSNSQSKKIWAIRIPKLDCPFTGTGDLFTALMTGWLRKTDFNLKLSLENTANTIHDILEDTLKLYDGSVRSHELRLVQNQDKIRSPSTRFEAFQLNAENSKGLSITNVNGGDTRGKV